MYLKRVYKDGKLDHILHIRSGPKQNFSTQLVSAAIAEGWMTLGQRKLILHCKPEDIVYHIVRIPGRYCCFCGEKLPDDSSGEMARTHVRECSNGRPSPDPQNPAGYCMINAYECEKEDEVEMHTSPTLLDRFGRWLGVR